MFRSCLVALLFTLAIPVTAADTAALVGQALVTADRPTEDLERDPAEKPVEVLTFFGLQPGMAVADVMSGGGYYAELLSRVVGPKGRVIAQNNAAYFSYAGRDANKRFVGRDFPNVERMTTELDDMGLGNGALDMILMVMSYHDAYWIGEEWPAVDTDLFMKQLFAALKPGGVVAIVDHVAPAGSDLKIIDKLHRIDPEFVKAEFARYGFRLDGESDLLRNPADDHTRVVFDESVRRKTDRFIFRFRKP